MFRFKIGDMFGLTVVVALAVAWLIDHALHNRALVFERTANYRWGHPLGPPEGKFWLTFRFFRQA